jgi:hypothetical protein
VSGRFFLWLATAGFIASAVLHLGTFIAHLPPPGDGIALALFAGAFVPLVAMLIRLRGAVPPSPGGRMAGLRAVVGLVPSGARMLIVGVSPLYADEPRVLADAHGRRDRRRRWATSTI